MFVTTPGDIFADSAIITGFIVDVGIVDFTVVEEVEVVDAEDVEDVEEIEVGVEVVDDIEVDDTDVEGGWIIIPPLPLPPPLPEGATVVVRVVLDVEVLDVDDVEVDVDAIDVDVEVDVDVVDVVVDCDIVIELSCMLLTVTGFDAESVMNTFADIVLPASAVGTSHRKVLLVPVIPVYRAFAIRASVTVLNTR